MGSDNCQPRPPRNHHALPLDVQSDLFDGLDSRMVIPLRRLQAFPKIKLSNRLTPIITIEGEEFLLETSKMGAVQA